MPLLATFGAGVALGGCVMPGGGPLPGTPEYAAAQVSRGYDCGLRPDRQRIANRLRPEERRRFAQANALYAVRSYNAPQACGSFERSRVGGELNALGGR
jgi:hypothetical protein